MSTTRIGPSLIDQYRDVVRIRKFEEKVISLFRDGLVPGFTHVSIGQEAVAVGVCSALRPADRIASNHRGHGHILAKGADSKRMMAEILGRAEGYCHGMGGELHIMDASINIIGANGIVGAGIPIAVGAALGDTLNGNDNVTVCFFGDGATSEGYFHEALNLAALWSLPIVFMCENNKYGEFTSVKDACAGNLQDRARGYGIPGVMVDGQDAAIVQAATSEAVTRARSGAGPTLLEADTYRWYGHFYGEEALTGEYEYRPAEEVERWKTQRDPLTIARRRALDDGASEAELEQVTRDAATEIEEAARFALEGTPPPPEQAMDHLFAVRIADPAGKVL